MIRYNVSVNLFSRRILVIIKTNLCKKEQPEKSVRRYHKKLRCNLVVLNLKHSGSRIRDIGIICHLSSIGNFIGIYYSDLDTKKNKQPIGSAHKTCAMNYKKKYELDTSYFPFNDLHIKYKGIVINTIQQIFPEFTEFDNRFADHKIKSVQLDDEHYASIDLFQVLFGVHINGVI